MRSILIIFLSAVSLFSIGCQSTSYAGQLDDRGIIMYQTAQPTSQIGSIVDNNGNVIIEASSIYKEDLTKQSHFWENILWDYESQNALYSPQEMKQFTPYPLRYPANTDRVEVVIGNGNFVIFHTWIVASLEAYDSLKDKQTAKKYADYGFVYREASAGSVLYKLYDTQKQLMTVDENTLRLIVGEKNLADWKLEDGGFRYTKRLYLGYQPESIGKYWPKK